MNFYRTRTHGGINGGRSRPTPSAGSKACGVARTHVGLVRDSNEDAYIANDQLGLYAVCDGMGGHQAGEVASAEAVAAIESTVARCNRADRYRRSRRAREADHLEQTVAAAVNQSATSVYRRALGEPSLHGMGTTTTVLLVGRRSAAMAHVGDSRLYRIRDRSAIQVSNDHTVPAELVRSGVLSPDNAAHHPSRHVLTRSIGPQIPVDVDTCLFDVQPGDRLLLCSDGLSDLLPTAPRWLAERSALFSTTDFVNSLISYALAAGAPDNVTVVAVDIRTGHRWPSRLPIFEQLEQRSPMTFSPAVHAA